MKTTKLLVASMIAGACALSSQGAGFALYGGSAKGMALSGASVGKALDASANFYNPATLSDLTNTVFTVGTGIEIPRCDVSVLGSDGSRYNGRMCPGTFMLPHAYVAQPLPWGFTFGLGLAAEYGLGSQYADNWPINWDSTETTIQGFVVNPNLAFAITDDWSISGGFRILYATFEQYSRPGNPYAPMVPGRLYNHIKADNDFSDWGWTVSTRYKILKNLQVGLMYRSYIDTHFRGHSMVEPGNVPFPYGQLMGSQASGRGGANVRLPQSITAGINWDVTDEVHLGYSMIWTRWSSLDKLDFELPTGTHTTDLDWQDTFRFAIGGSWDFAQNWALMGSYCYDIDPCSTDENVGSTILPAGDRHIISGGLSWRWHDFEICGAYGIILMSSRDQVYQESPTSPEYRFSTRHGLSHQIGLTLSYYF